jgi:DNA-directed RNA polymerase subunit RPC12/RpoP
MSASKIVGYVISGILILFGVLFLLAAFAPDTGVNPAGRLVVGAILVGIGLAIIVIIKMREPKPEQKVVVEQKIDLSGDIELEKLQCKNCGAELDKSSITLAQGAIIVSCPYCGTSYQIVEEPKW